MCGDSVDDLRLSGPPPLPLSPPSCPPDTESLRVLLEAERVARARAEAALPLLVARVAALEGQVEETERMQREMMAELTEWREGARGRKVGDLGDGVSSGLPVLVGNVIKRQRKG